jgi:YD repeat-containing protein
VWDPDGGVSYGYDADGRRNRTTYPNGVTETFTYDDANRILGVTTRAANGTLIEGFEYAYDKAGNRLTMEDDRGTTSYAYDELHRLVTEASPSGATTTYTYDKLRNRIAKDADGFLTTYSYDADGRMTTVASRKSV